MRELTEIEDCLLVNANELSFLWALAADWSGRDDESSWAPYIDQLRPLVSTWVRKGYIALWVGSDWPAFETGRPVPADEIDGVLGAFTAWEYSEEPETVYHLQSVMTATDIRSAETERKRAGSDLRVWIDHEAQRLEEFLGRTAVRLSPDRTVRLRELLEFWAQDVARLAAETEGAVEGSGRSGRWNAYDMAGALYVRDRVEREIGAAPEELREALALAVRGADERYRSFTEDDPRMLVARNAGDVVEDQGWWWKRLPVAGSVRDDALEYGRWLDADG